MFNFPWSNFHELNLDWILSVVKEAKEIFVKGEGDIQHAVETADQALETAEQAAAGVIADGAVTIPKLNSEVYSLFAYCVSGSVAPNFIPAGALVILRKSTIYNVTDGIYTATRNIPQAAIITAADLDQSATLYREGGMNYLLHNEEKLSGTIDLIKAGLVILVTGDEASAAVPADGLVYVANNTHGLTEGFYFNTSGATFPTTGGTADSDSFTAVNNILNALQTAISTLGSDDIANDSTVTGASVTDALDAVKNTLNQLKTDAFGNINLTGTNNTGSTITAGTFFYNNGSLVRAKINIQNGSSITIGTNTETVTAGGLNSILEVQDATTAVSFLHTAVSFHRQGNIVIALYNSDTEGAVPNGSLGTVGTIPSGFIPKENSQFFPQYAASAVENCMLRFNTDGTITAHNYSSGSTGSVSCRYNSMVYMV